MSSSSHPSMALCFSCTTSKPFCFSNSSYYSKQTLLLFPLRKKYSQSLCIVSASGSNQNNSQDDEVDNLGVKAALSMLKFYKNQQDCVTIDCQAGEISPIMPKSCRYIPTCSEYSMIAYKKYGVVKGTVLTAWRLCRCNPLGGSGFDPPRWFDEESPPQE